MPLHNGCRLPSAAREPEAAAHDIVMPEMDGIELARVPPSSIPTSRSCHHGSRLALNPDSQAPKDAKVLSKPFHLRDLVNEVQKMLAA